MEINAWLEKRFMKKRPFLIYSIKWKRLGTIFNPKIPSWAKVEGLEHGDVLPQLSCLVARLGKRMEALDG